MVHRSEVHHSMGRYRPAEHRERTFGFHTVGIFSDGDEHLSGDFDTDPDSFAHGFGVSQVLGGCVGSRCVAMASLCRGWVFCVGGVPIFLCRCSSGGGSHFVKLG